MTTKINLYNSWDTREQDLPEKLPEFIQRLTEMLETVPSEFHDEVVIEISTEEDSSSTDIDIFYIREETPEEEAKRKADDADWRKSWQERRRREYEQLKKEFEP